MVIEPKTRLRLISGLFVCVALLFIWRLYSIQILSGQDYRDRADRQYVHQSSGNLERGDIYFTDKTGTPVIAATVRSGFLLAINPSVLENSEDVYQKLNEITPIDHTTFTERAAKKTDPYEVVAGQLSSDLADKIHALDITGVILAQDKWRFYPGDTMAAHTVGLMGFQGDEYAGRYGLERYYQDVLKKNVSETQVNFFAELFTNLKKTFIQDDRSGGSIYTTIEPAVQSYVEDELAKYVKEWHPKYAGAIVINPNDGAIYAMALTPTFNPNSYQDVSSVNVFTNKLIEDVDEMGSIIKPLTMAAGIDAGVVTPETTYNDKGYLVLNGKKISNWDGKGRGIISMQEVLNQSLNTGVSFVVGKLGNQRFADYFRSFGFGSRTGIDLPNESIGLLDNLKSPRDVEYATASFGQGIAMTPIQTVRALSVLANGGKLITPHVVDKIQYDLTDKKVELPAPVQVIKPETAEAVTGMLIKVVDGALAHGTKSMEHYSIAAKTGTAQIADPVNGGYLENTYLHSFFGYFPAYKPRALVFLYSYEPNAEYASQTFTDPFMDITSFLIHYYDMAPDR
jgi:cell division protein FtsI/penicillin-binding protein 2